MDESPNELAPTESSTTQRFVDDPRDTAIQAADEMGCTIDDTLGFLGEFTGAIACSLALRSPKSGALVGVRHWRAGRTSPCPGQRCANCSWSSDDLRALSDASGTAISGQHLTCNAESTSAADAPSLTCSTLTLPLIERDEIHGAVRLFGAAGQHREWSATERHAARLSANALCAAHGRVIAERQTSVSDERLRQLVEQAPVSIEIYDATGIRIMANATWAKLWEVADANTRTLSYSIFEDAQIKALGYDQPIRRALRGETSRLVAVPFDPADSGLPGRKRWTDTLVFPIRSKSGEAPNVVVLHEDATERIQTRSELDVFKRFADASGQGCAWATLETRIAYANGALLRLVAGAAQADVLDCHLEELFEPGAGEYVRSELLPRVRAGETWTGELPVRTKDGTLTPVVASLFLISDETGAPLYLGSTFTDLTDRTRSEAKRSKMEARIQHAHKLESLGILAGGIAHDFNNLLCGIVGTADLAMESLEPSHPAHEDLSLLAETAQRATELCRQMLAYSGKGQFVIEPVNLSLLIEAMLPLLDVSMPKKASLCCLLSPDLPLIEGDVTQLRQLVLNLVVNASEALGDIPGSITISTGWCHCDTEDFADTFGSPELSAGEYVYLEIMDTGAGMDEATRSRVFDPFFSTKFTGRGLGLAAVLGIVRGHEGAIRVRSEVGRGTSFKAMIPAARPATSTAEEPSAARRTTQREQVLFVDDDPSVRSIGKRMLEKLGFDVVTAVDGPSGVEAFRTTPDAFALVLLDVRMPGLDGEQAYRELSRTRPNVRVVMMSGCHEQETRQRFAGMPLAGFLPKPFRLETLAAQVRAALGRSAP